MNDTHERNIAEESSMEDILASIRQILASDDVSEETPEKSASKGKSYHDDVIELTEEVHPTSASIQQHENVNMATKTFEQDENLISKKTVEAASHALSKLNEALQPAQSMPVMQHTHVGGITLEALVTQAMQPILKDWMDQNLPQVIERVVATEIKKLVRQAS